MRDIYFGNDLQKDIIFSKNIYTKILKVLANKLKYEEIYEKQEEIDTETKKDN